MRRRQGVNAPLLSTTELFDELAGELLGDAKVPQVLPDGLLVRTRVQLAEELQRRAVPAQQVHVVLGKDGEARAAVDGDLPGRLQMSDRTMPAGTWVRRACPSLASRSPIMILMSVDLPAPLAPTTACNQARPVRQAG